MKLVTGITIILLFISCNNNAVFNVTPKKIGEIEIEEAKPKLFIYKSLSNTTTNESIQLGTE